MLELVFLTRLRGNHRADKQIRWSQQLEVEHCRETNCWPGCMLRQVVIPKHRHLARAIRWWRFPSPTHYDRTSLVYIPSPMEPRALDVCAEILFVVEVPLVFKLCRLKQWGFSRMLFSSPGKKARCCTEYTEDDSRICLLRTVATLHDRNYPDQESESSQPSLNLSVEGRDERCRMD